MDEFAEMGRRKVTQELSVRRGGGQQPSLGLPLRLLRKQLARQMGTPKWVKIDRNSHVGRLGRFQMNFGNAAEVWCSGQKEENYLPKKDS